jgi:hypothetical protein
VPPRVHILATCRNPELLPATLLVFKSIRVGFPTAEIHVVYNNLSLEHEGILNGENRNYHAETILPLTSTIIHHEWITLLLEHETEPFFICDTDMVFWNRSSNSISAMPHWPAGTARNSIASS